MQEQPSTFSSIGEDRIREAFEYAASGMAITDLQGCFQQTNPAYLEIVGRTQRELDSESILSITHQEDREKCRNHLDSLVSGATKSFVLDKRYVRPDGDTIWVRNSFSLLRDERGQPSHIILICNDITEHRRAERLLAETEKLALVGQLTSSIAHEINNPLEAVLNLLYLVREAPSLDEARQYAVQAEQEVQRAAHIASQTLKFHTQQSRPTQTNIAHLMESVLTLFKGKFTQNKVQIRYEKHGEPELVCYSGEIRQVLANLVRNSIEAMPQGGKLRIRVRPATDWRSGGPGVRITVADTGYGISSQTRHHIYKPFFTTKGALGTGLGLWVTAGILAKHRGSIHLRSRQAPGDTGTAFTLIFPTIGAEGEVAGIPERTQYKAR
jgi:PAS domain S-box-containing protein